MTSGYGYRWHPVTGGYIFHYGVDFGGSCSSKTIKAVGDGTVVGKYYNAYRGYVVEVRVQAGGSSFVTRSQHLSGPAQVSVGQSVSKGQALGTMGATGAVTGVHLHFEVLQGGSNINPQTWLERYT